MGRNGGITEGKTGAKKYLWGGEYQSNFSDLFPKKVKKQRRKNIINAFTNLMVENHES